MKLPSACLVLLGLAAPALAQEPAPVYQTKKSSVGFHLDTLFRQEWTNDLFVAAGQFDDDQRRRIQIRPRLEFGAGALKLGVGGEFNHGSDKNVEPKPALLRDNYDSRGIRLDLAFAQIEPVRWLRIEGGRFLMPVGLTEMVWDEDLRPQGGAVTLQHKDDTGLALASVTGLWAKGSHVFDDEKTTMLLVSGQLTLPGQKDSSLQFIGSYLQFQDVDRLEPMLGRQNTRVFGELVNDYRIVDLVARIRPASDMPVQLVANYCWNTAVGGANKGLWLAAVLGSITTSRARAEYTYAKVDKDAVVGAYATDDFVWATGWQGHRGELATRISDKVSIHAIGQLQKFKDSPHPEERDQDVKRLRLEIRGSY